MAARAVGVHLTALVLAVLALAVGGCAGGVGTPAQPAGRSGVVHLTRADGSTYDLAPVGVECRPGDGPGAPTQVYVHSALDEVHHRSFYLVAPLAVVADGHAFTLPAVAGAGLAFAVLDGDRRLDVASTGARGSLRIVSATCEPRPCVVLRVRGRVGAVVAGGASEAVRADVTVDGP